MHCRPLSLLLAVALLAVAVCAKPANVVYYEPKLDMDLADVIHPYAWAEQRPEPYYENHMNAYNVANDHHLASFLDVQTHLAKSSPAAAALVQVAETKGIFRKLKGLVKGVTDPNVNVDGALGRMGVSNTNNPAAKEVRKLNPMPSDFTYNPPAKDATGSFPGSEDFRRAVYGVRRRRLPYFSSKEGFGSANPYRRVNDFFKAPSDMFLPKSKFFAHSAAMFDYGRAHHHASNLPYGGYSSFRHARFRGDPAGYLGAQEPGQHTPIIPGIAGHLGMEQGIFGHSFAHTTENNMRFLSDGSMIPSHHFKETSFGVPPPPQFSSVPSPFIGNEHKFRDFFGAGLGGGESSQAAGSS